MLPAVSCVSTPSEFRCATSRTLGKGTNTVRERSSSRSRMLTPWPSPAKKLKQLEAETPRKDQMIALRILQEPKSVIAWLAREDLSKASCGVFTHGGTKGW